MQFHVILYYISQWIKNFMRVAAIHNFTQFTKNNICAHMQPGAQQRRLSSLQGLFTKPSYVMQLQKLRPDANIECIIFLLKDEINVVSSNVFRTQLDVDCSKKF